MDNWLFGGRKNVALCGDVEAFLTNEERDEWWDRMEAIEGMPERHAVLLAAMSALKNARTMEEALPLAREYFAQTRAFRPHALKFAAEIRQRILDAEAELRSKSK